VAKFRYIAVDNAGKRQNGVIEAANAPAVAELLHRQSCLLLRADEVGKNGRWLDFVHADLSFRRGLSTRVIAHITRELSVMLEAGQDIDHALRFGIETAESDRARAVLESIRDQVRGGKSLAASLAEHKQVFSRLYISLVRAGEAGGQLAESLARLADLLERESRLASAVQSALIYPIFLVVASIGAVILLLTYVLPQFTPIFAQAGARLPFMTRALLAAGDFVRDDGEAVLVVLLVLFLIAYRALREPPARMAAERALLLVPVIGPLICRVQAARLMRTLGTLLRNGVGLVPALTIGHDVLGNLLAAKVVERAMTEVKAGAGLGTALASGHFFPVQTIHLVRLGEETGKLAEMALRAADVHDDQVHHTIQRMVALLVPVITIAMGLVVAAIVGSLLVAMLSLNDLAL
jgi:general secretion pathway protein F